MEVNDATQEVTQPVQEPQIDQSIKQKGYFLPILIAIVIFVVLSAGGYSLYQKQNRPLTNTQSGPQPTSIVSSPSSTPTSDQTNNSSQSGIAYKDPCKDNDKKGCIMQNAYSKLKKSSQSQNYTIIWADAFKICDANQNDSTILYSVEQCKLDVCDNLALGDGQLKNNYPEADECKKEVLPVCKDGSIIGQIPCACNVPAGPNTAYTKDWLDNYWNKYRKNDPPIYCCSGKQQDSACSVSQ